MKLFKTISMLVIAAASFAAPKLSAAAASFKNNDYAVSLNYTESAAPGDAVYVRMILKNTHRRSRKNSQEATAVLELYQEDKRMEHVQFFSVNPKAKKQASLVELLACIPLSTWLTDGKYSLKIIFADGETDAKEFYLPFTLVPKEFVSEKLPLDEKNTAIKTDTGTERTAQISKLNDILATINTADVFTLKPFTTPVAADTRRSSGFGDRRIYEFSTGKTSANLHYGIDYAVPAGTDIHACGDGKVMLAENRISTGWSVVIEHAPGVYSLYYHMNSLNVKEGENVRQGEKIGVSGATGLATGPHLHWEIRMNMEAVSPDFFTSDYAFSGKN